MSAIVLGVGPGLGASLVQAYAETGRQVAAVSRSGSEVAGGIPFWKRLLSTFLALGSTGSGTVIAIIAFLLVIGGAFHALDECGVLSYMFNRVYRLFETQRYRLLLLVSLFFMSLGAFVGSFEECVPLVPIAVALAYSLGWDALVGLGLERARGEVPRHGVGGGELGEAAHGGGGGEGH